MGIYNVCAYNENHCLYDHSIIYDIKCQYCHVKTEFFNNLKRTKGK